MLLGNSVTVTGQDSGVDILADPTVPDWLKDIISGAKELLTQYNQQRIYDLQIERASQGLPPLDLTKYSPQYNLGLAPDIKNLLILGGIGFAIFIMMKRR